MIEFAADAVAHIVAHHPEAGAADQVRHILHVAAAIIVKTHNFVILQY